jgi:hypothetical protein
VSRKARTIELEEDLAFQRKEWFWQRVGIVLLSLFVLAAVLGVTGAGGPLADAEIADPSGRIRVAYERVVRREAVSELRIHLQSDPPGFIQFWIDAPYLELVNVISIEPEPQTSTVENERHIYTVRAGSSAVTVSLETKHARAGRVEGSIGIVNGPSVRFTQFSWF